MAHVHANWLSPSKIRTMVIGGSSKTVVWDDLNSVQRLSIHDRGVERTVAGDLGAEARKQAIISYRTGDTVAPALPEKEALRGVLAEFAASIAEKRAPLTDGWSGLRVLAILEAGSESLAKGGVFVKVQSEGKA
jgi:predicted dehydrogenase